MATIKFDMPHIDAMNGHEFEHFIATLMRKLGYQNVEVTRGSGDQGVDVLAEKEGVRYAVQCKCYSSDLGNTPVQEVNTGRVIYHCHVGVVVTNRHFTQGAKEAAKATGVLLWDRSKLQELMIQAESIEQSISNEDALLKRGFMALEDGEWRKADKLFEQVLDLNAECGEAYFGKVLIAAHATSLEELRKKLIQLDTIKDFARAMQFSSGAQLQALQDVNELLQKKWQEKEDDERRRKEKEARLLEEQEKARQAELEAERRRKEEEARAALEQKEAWIARVSPYWKLLRNQSLLSAGSSHTVGVKADGTVITTGSCQGPDWKDIVAVTTRGSYTVGLKIDGTVIRAWGEELKRYSDKYNLDAQKEVSSWANIIAVAAGDLHTVGLKADGSVVAVGWSDDRCDVSNWTNIVEVAAGWGHTVGLKSDGTVVIAGNHPLRKKVSSWTDIVAVAAGFSHTVGLKSDGTVVAVGKNDCGQCNVSDWKDIVAVAAQLHTVGLKSDGTVVAVGSNDCGQCNVSDWKDIVAVAAGGSHTVGLKADGTVVAAGENSFDQCSVSDWKLFNAIETLEQERVNTRAAKVVERQRIALEIEKASLQKKLFNLWGLFADKRRSQIESQLAEIEEKLKAL